MAQDMEKSLEEANRNLQVIPLGCSAQRATTFEVRFDGGAFALHIYEARESPEPRPAGPIAQWQLVEIGRFALSPVAFSRLTDQLAVAGKMYSGVMGRPPIGDAENTSLTKSVAHQVFSPLPAPAVKKR
jgi:hypothetical protein